MLLWKLLWELLWTLLCHTMRMSHFHYCKSNPNSGAKNLLPWTLLWMLLKTKKHSKTHSKKQISYPRIGALTCVNWCGLFKSSLVVGLTYGILNKLHCQYCSPFGPRGHIQDQRVEKFWVGMLSHRLWLEYFYSVYATQSRGFFERDRYSLFQHNVGVIWKIFEWVWNTLIFMAVLPHQFG